MSSRSARRTKRKKIIVLGESDNDTHAIAEFLRACLPIDGSSIDARRQPQVLIKDARPDQIPSRAAAIRAVIRAEQTDSTVVAVVVHEDCDAVEPAHVALSSKLTASLSDLGVQVITAVPAWEMETWLMQWPEAFARYRPAWQSISKYDGRNVGLIANAKEVLQRDLRPTRGKTRDYRESDAPGIAAIVHSNGWVSKPRAKSESFDLFVSQLARL